MRKQQSSPPEDLHSASVLAASLLVKLYPFRVIEVSLSRNLAYGVMRGMSGCSDKAGFWETFWEKSGLTRILISAAWEESKMRLSIHNICLIFVFHFSKKTLQNKKFPALTFVFYFNRHWILTLFMKVTNLLSFSQIHRGSNMRMPLFSLPLPLLLFLPSSLPLFLFFFFLPPLFPSSLYNSPFLLWSTLRNGVWVFRSSA